MSFRGTHPTKFRRSGNRGHEQPSFRERCRPFKRKYEDRRSPSLKRFQDHGSSRGRQRSVERERDDSDRGGGRPFKTYFTGSRTRPSSRGRYFRGRLGHYYRDSRGRRPDSPREFNRERSFEKYGSHTDDCPKEREFVDKKFFDRRTGTPDEWFQNDEVYNSGEEHVPLERGVRSPLTIHRRFGSEEFDQNPHRSPVRTSRSFLRRSPSFERLRSPVERHQRFEGRSDSIENERSVRIEMRGHFTENRRSLGIDERDRFVENKQPDSPVERLRREGRKRSLDYNRHSFDRSLSPPRTYRSRERSFRGSDRERSIVGSTTRSIERQIPVEKERFHEVLGHENNLHEKRSESSIERLLDSCKKTFDNKIKSPTISRSNSFERDNYLRRKNERSLSPFDHLRKFKGLENITIKRGRSLERSISPVGSQRRVEYSPDRQRSPDWNESYRVVHEDIVDSGRRSRSPLHQRKQYVSRDSSPEMLYDIKPEMSNITLNRILQEKGGFLGEQERPFLRDQEGAFLGEQGRSYSDERSNSRESIRRSYRHSSIDNQEKTDSSSSHIRIVKKSGNVFGHSSLDNQEKTDSSSHVRIVRESGHVFRHSSLDNQEKTDSSSSHLRIVKETDHFLGVGDGPFLENRSIGKDKKECDNYKKEERGTSSISQRSRFDGEGGSKRRQYTSPIPQPGRRNSMGDITSITTRFKGNLEPSPVSQPGNFERKEFTDYEDVRPDSRFDLSPISQTGSFEKREFSQDMQHDKLSLISQSESFGKELFDKNSESRNSRTKRSVSEDSMQKFLAELEHDDISRFSDGRSNHIKEKDESFEDVCYRQSGEERKQYIPVKKDYKSRGELNDTLAPNMFSQLSSNISKEKDISDKSYYNFNFSYDSELNKKSDKPSNKNKPQDELFNAYEESFMNQTSDPYNENLFQGRYEQSANKLKNKPSKMDQQICIPKEIPVLSSYNNKTEFHLLIVPPPAQQASTEPQSYQSSDKNYTQISPYLQPDNQNLLNQIIQNPNIFSGNNIRPGISFHNQAIRPTFSFEKPLPVIPPIAFQANALLPNQSIQNLQRPESLMPWANPMFSRRPDEMCGKQNINWQNQSTDFPSNTPGKFSHSSYPAQSSNREQVPFSQTISQTGTMPLNPVSQNMYPNPKPQLSGKPLSSNVLPADQRANEFQPFLAWSGPKRVLANTLSGGNSMKTSRVQHNIEEVTVINDDEGNENYNVDQQLVYKSLGVIVPTTKVVEMYKNCTPTYDVLGKILNGFVIYFGAKENSELEKDPLEVLQESFSNSEGFAGLDIVQKIEYKHSWSHPMQVCELRWKGLLLSKAEGKSREEARQAASIALINALAKTCYTIQTKYEYYNLGRYPEFMLKHPEQRGYYKMVKRDEVVKSITESVNRLRGQGIAKGVDATHVNAVISFMDEYFKDQETHCELIFGPTSCMEYTHAELQTIYEHARGKGLQCRWFSGNKEVDVFGKFLCVSRYFSPQALQRYLLAEKGDTIRYRLFPPQGPKIELLVLSGQYSRNIIKSIYGQSSPEKSHRDCPHSQGDCHCDHRWNQPEPPGLGWGPTYDQSHQTSQPRPRSHWGPTDDQSHQTSQPKPCLLWGPTDDQSHQTTQPRPRSRWGPTNDQSHQTSQPRPRSHWGPTDDQSHQTSQPRPRSRWGPTSDQSNQPFQSSSNNSSPRFQGPKNTFPR